jgi:hypothetical protein
VFAKSPWSLTELLQDRRHRPLPLGILAVLHDREEDPRRDGRAVERVHRLEPALRAVADAEPSGLEVGRIRRRRDLPVALLTREPRLDVVLLRCGRAQVARRHVDDPVRDLELLDELLLDGKESPVLFGRLLRQAEDEHLDLVELVHAEHPARVLARGARLAAEARRVARVVERQRAGVQLLVHVHRRERHLGGAGEVKVVPLDPVDVDLVGGEEARSVHGGFADEDGRQDRREALPRQPVESEPVERELREGRVAEPVSEAGAGHLGASLHVDLGQLEVIARLEVELRRLGGPPDLFRVLVGEAVGGARIRRIGEAREELVASRRGLLQRSVGLLQLLLQTVEPLQLFRRGFARSGRLPRSTQLIDARVRGSPALVGGEKLVEDLGRALAGKRRAPGFGIGACGANVDHARESKTASITWATPSSVTGGHT